MDFRNLSTIVKCQKFQFSVCSMTRHPVSVIPGQFQHSPNFQGTTASTWYSTGTSKRTRRECRPGRLAPKPIRSVPMASPATGALPTHTVPSSKVPADDDLHLQRRRSRRRCRCICLLVTLGVLLLLGVTLLVLFLTVLRVRDPTTRLVSTRFVGLSPSLTQLNFTVLLTVAVHNPNPASFSYASGATQLWYRGAHVGDAQVDPGHIPSKGDGIVQLEMTVLTSSFTADMAQLIKDIEAGSLPLDASARIPGRVAIFGVFKLNVVAYSDCHIVVGFPDMSIRGQECRDHTKL